MNEVNTDHRAVSRFSRKDAWTAVAFFAAAFALRVPFRTQMAYYWDGAQYALAITDYNATRSQPQVPGYFLYVMLGRAVNVLVHEPHESLVWMSVVAGAALAAGGYLLGAAMFGRGCGWAAAVILVTSPLCWFHSEVALTNIVDAALVTGTVLVCWLTLQEKGRWRHVVALSVMMALVAGVRQQSAPMLVPAWLYAFARMRPPRWPKVVVGVALTATLCLTWFVPMLQMSGGWNAYWAAIAAKARFDAPKTPWRGGFAALERNVDLIVEVCWAGLLMAAVIATALFAWWMFAGSRANRQRFYDDHQRQFRLLALWIVPMLAFGLGAYMTMTGYVLSYFPGLAIAVAAVVGKVKKRAVLVALLALIAAVNCAAFLSLCQGATQLMLGLPLTAVELREHDRTLAEDVAFIRREFNPKSTIICHGCQHFYWGFRHFQYHLPEYRNLLLDHDASLVGDSATKFWLSQNGRTAFVDQLPDRSHETMLLVVPPGLTLSIYQRFLDVRMAEPVSRRGLLYVLHARAAQE